MRTAKSLLEEGLIVEGKAPYYTRAGEMGLLYVPFGDEGSPLDERVGRHIPTVSTLLEVFSLHNPDWAIIVDNLPSLSGAFAFSAFLYPHARRFALRRPYLPLGRTAAGVLSPARRRGGRAHGTPVLRENPIRIGFSACLDSHSDGFNLSA